MIVLRHLLAVAALPFVMAVLVPLWIARGDGVTLRLATTTLTLAVQAIGAIILLVGLTLGVSTVRRFARDGEGTLAPWDPPRHLVVSGPYRYVRNPMISGVVLVLLAESLILLSPPHLIWTAIFFGINAIYIPLLEEPQLARRFGAEYDKYRQHVPRLIPRVRPWTPTSHGSRAPNGAA